MKSYNHLYEKTISETNRRYALSQAKHSKRFRKIMKHLSYGNNQGRDLDFMGFRFYRNRTILRKSIMYKATRKARKISKKEKTTILDARQMLSYLGWIDCTDTYLMYRKWIKPCINFQQLKRKVSRYDKNDEKRVYQKLVSLYTAKGGKSHGVELQVRREHSPTDCT